MPRFRVTATTHSVYIVDASSASAASSEGINLAEARVRPAYALGSTAEVEFYSDTSSVGVMRKRTAANTAEAER